MFAILVTVQLSHVFLITILIDQYSYDFLGFQPGRFLLCQYSLMETDYFEPSVLLSGYFEGFFLHIERVYSCSWIEHIHACVNSVKFRIECICLPFWLLCSYRMCF